MNIPGYINITRVGLLGLIQGIKFLSTNCVIKVAVGLRGRTHWNVLCKCKDS